MGKKSFYFDVSELLFLLQKPLDTKIMFQQKIKATQCLREHMPNFWPSILLDLVTSVSYPESTKNCSLVCSCYSRCVRSLALPLNGRKHTRTQLIGLGVGIGYYPLSNGLIHGWPPGQPQTSRLGQGREAIIESQVCSVCVYR